MPLYELHGIPLEGGVVDSIASGLLLRRGCGFLTFRCLYGPRSLFTIGVLLSLMVCLMIRRWRVPSPISTILEAQSKWESAHSDFEENTKQYISSLGGYGQKVYFKPDYQEINRDRVMRQLMRQMCLCHDLRRSLRERIDEFSNAFDYSHGLKNPPCLLGKVTEINQQMLKTHRAHQNFVLQFESLLMYCPPSPDACPVKAWVREGELFMYEGQGEKKPIGTVGWFSALEHVQPTGCAFTSLTLFLSSQIRQSKLVGYKKRIKSRLMCNDLYRHLAVKKENIDYEEGTHPTTEDDKYNSLLQSIISLKEREDAHLGKVAAFEGKIRDRVVYDDDSQTFSQERKGLDQQEKELEEVLAKLASDCADANIRPRCVTSD